jgi:hypothetical protein
MAPLASYLRLSFVGLGAIVAVLPVCSGACGRTACFEYSLSQYAATNGCPSQASAIANFTSSACPAAVVSVDSAGSFEDNELCCYAVTQVDVDPVGIGGCFGVGVGGAGGNGTGAFGGETSGFTVSEATGVGVGGAQGVTSSSSGTPGGCLTCNAELLEGGGTANQLCADAAQFWDALTQCACSGPCGPACGASFCVGMPDTACSTCLSDTSANGCSMQLMSCDDN